LAKFARFDFERRRPLLYGQKQEAGGQQVVVVRMSPLRGGGEEVESVEVGQVQSQAHAVSQSRGLPRLRDSVAQVQAGEGEEEEESENGDEAV
jgi:hypothetical protein